MSLRQKALLIVVLLFAVCIFHNLVQTQRLFRQPRDYGQILPAGTPISRFANLFRRRRPQPPPPPPPIIHNNGEMDYDFFMY